MLKRLLLLTLIGITACNMEAGLDNNNPPPKPRVVLDKTTQKGSASLYKCKEDKEIKVVRTTESSKNTKKVKTDEILLTFEGVTEKLTATLYQTGKFYTSIHWQWLEETNNNSLRSSVGQLLADECVEQ
ncbi:MliC family protein [Lonepinella sp. BR2271]|uniref:MliC family protein n=1 Tax=Lonepinella sp. BR2271 TaxID=3434550 RepID=UPI003F6E1A24